LHGSNPQFIHRDFKTSNLLVGENNRIKICDFGLSQIKRQGENLLDGKDGAKGTPLWMAPEVLAGREFNEKADVYRCELFSRNSHVLGFYKDFIIGC
jgi:serine/threonine protein kinase